MSSWTVVSFPRNVSHCRQANHCQSVVEERCFLCGTGDGNSREIRALPMRFLGDRSWLAPAMTRPAAGYSYNVVLPYRFSGSFVRLTIHLVHILSLQPFIRLCSLFFNTSGFTISHHVRSHPHTTNTLS